MDDAHKGLIEKNQDGKYVKKTQALPEVQTETITPLETPKDQAIAASTGFERIASDTSWLRKRQGATKDLPPDPKGEAPIEGNTSTKEKLD